MSGADRLVLIGQAAWVRSLAAGLTDAGLPVEAVPLQSVRDALSVATWRRVARSRVLVRVGFRPGARTWRGRVFDAALAATKGRSTVACYWIGTDVLHLLEDVAAGARVAKWRSAAAVRHHLAGSEPLRRELAHVGVDAALVGFPWRTVDPPDVLPSMPPAVTVLTYVPDTRATFYGGPALVEAARRLPQVRFLVMGGSGSWCDRHPSNVEFLGWVDDPAPLYAGSSAVVRVVDHDSIGGTAVEGLMFGRRVLYSQPLDHAVLVQRTADSLVEALQALVEDHRAGRLVPDPAASRWARREFDHRRRFAQLAEHLGDLSGSKLR
ncbi:hypothetical protein ACK8HX_09905 [Oryzobacter sp. R7]|uniref:hypothetical protein n=1 Tax=Oryzobacter faecalis TaxID=3388656 RepID=UPI00398CC46A